MHDAWLALIASCFGEIGWVDRPLYYYRQHGGNTLGAEKGDSLDSVRARVKDGSSARENYRRMFGGGQLLPYVLQPSEPGTAGNAGGFHKTAPLQPAGKNGTDFEVRLYQEHAGPYTGADAVHWD